jgi:flavin-binding protein dodecin
MHSAARCLSRLISVLAAIAVTYPVAASPPSPPLAPVPAREFRAAQTRATDRLQRLVESLLDFGRMEAGARGMLIFGQMQEGSGRAQSFSNVEQKRLYFSVMLLGNAPDEVQQAIMEALPRGTSYGNCHEHEYEFAKLFCDMVPGVDKVTFCNSGTEAVEAALADAQLTTKDIDCVIIGSFEPADGYSGPDKFIIPELGCVGKAGLRCRMWAPPVA